MLHPCSQCDEGYQEHEEDGRPVNDVCYHCLGSGKIDAETFLRDQLTDVAMTLATRYVIDFKRKWDTNNEHWNQRAGEVNMTSAEYFRAQVLDHADQFLDRLLEMPAIKQEVLIAWNELPCTNVNSTLNVPADVPIPRNFLSDLWDGDITW